MDLQYVSSAWQKTYSAVSQNKGLFIALLIIQFLFLASLSYSSVTRSLSIVENLQEITAPLESITIDLDNPQDSSSQVYQESFALASAYGSLQRSLSHFSLELLGIFVFFHAFLWVLTAHLVESQTTRKAAHKTFKELTKHLLAYWLKYLLAAAILLFPFCLLSFSYLRSFANASTQAFTVAFELLLFFVLVILYLLVVSAASIASQSYKDFHTKIFHVALRNIHHSLLVLFVALLPVALAFFALYLFSLVIPSFFGILLSVFILLICFVLSRIYIVSCFDIIHQN